MTYTDFLARKTARSYADGREIDRCEVHPLLHNWQTEIVLWAVGKGRAAIFADCGLGKTFMQLEWARLSADTALVLAPLSVARQTVREAHKIGLEVTYVRSGEDVTGPGLWITNYEMADRFDPSRFGAVVLDESSILKNDTGSTRNRLIQQWKGCPRRLACTATPAPNDVAEMTNHAEFLGVMSRAEMLAAYFVHDDDGWRLKGHAVGPMFRWMASWAAALRRPSDMGYSDDGYTLPPLNIHGEVVHVEVQPDGQLFATDLGGIGGRHEVRRKTLDARVKRVVGLIRGCVPQSWIVWCGLNEEQAFLEKAFGDQAISVYGALDAEEKERRILAWLDGEAPILLSKPKVCGFGMNFQNCHRMVFVGLSDSYESYYQAIRRCWRFGQTQQVDVHIVVSELEQQIVGNVRRKEQEAARMTDRLVHQISMLKQSAVGV